MHSADDNRYLEEKERELLRGCPKCFGKNAACSCFGEYRAEMIKVTGSVPRKYRSASLDIFSDREVRGTILAVEDYICKLSKHAKEGTGLFLWGAGHYGKTHVACVVLNAVARSAASMDPNVMPSSHDPLLFINTHDLFNRLTFRGEQFGEDNKAAFLKRLETVKFLCIDDISYLYKKQVRDITYAESMLMGIFRNRANNLLPTIVTSECSMQQLKDENILIGAHVVNTLREHLISLKFPDHHAPGYDDKLGGENATKKVTRAAVPQAPKTHAAAAKTRRFADRRPSQDNGSDKGGAGKA